MQMGRSHMIGRLRRRNDPGAGRARHRDSTSSGRRRHSRRHPVGPQALRAPVGEQEHSRAGQGCFNSIIVADGFSAIESVLGWFAAPVMFRAIIHVPDEVRLAPVPQWRMAGLRHGRHDVVKEGSTGGRTRVFLGVAIKRNIINAKPQSCSSSASPLPAPRHGGLGDR